MIQDYNLIGTSFLPSGVSQVQLCYGELPRVYYRNRGEVKFLDIDGRDRWIISSAYSIPREIYFRSFGNDPSRITNSLRFRLCYACGLFGVTTVFWRSSPSIYEIDRPYTITKEFLCECIGAFVIGGEI